MARKQLNVYCTPDEYASFAALARSKGVSLSSLVVQALHLMEQGQVPDRQVAPPPPKVEPVARIEPPPRPSPKPLYVACRHDGRRIRSEGKLVCGKCRAILVG